jgi:uncharacterized protein YeaO (DUF488 family)
MRDGTTYFCRVVIEPLGRAMTADEHHVRLKRVYDPAATTDGARILVDRLWPRGLARETAALTGWFREIAPSNELRAWYGHVPTLFDEFASRYMAELAQPERQARITELRGLLDTGSITLLTATKDVAHSHAVILRGILSERAG